ncbi:MAG: glycosyltransferase [Candidatus Bathyarchaeia archaeon]
MNICMVSDLFDTPFGGVSRVIKRISEKLIAKGHAITIITSHYKNKTKIERKDGLAIYRLPSFGIPKSEGEYTLAFPHFKKVYEILRKENIEIVHCHTPSPLALSCVLAAKKLKIPKIGTHHLLAETFSLNALLGTKNFENFFYGIVNFFYNQLELVIGPSHYAVNVLKEHGLKVKSEVVSNGIDLTSFSPKGGYDDFFREFNLDDESWKILFVGRLMKEKGLDILFKAYKIVGEAMPNTRLILVGKGYLQKYLEKLAEELGINERVLFTGFVSDEMLKQAYLASDIFVLPSRAETQSLVLLEASAMGLPLIGARVTAIPELVRDGWNGYTFEPENHEDLARKIIKILSNEKLMEKFSKNSLKLAEEHDLNKSVDRLEEIYRSLLQSVNH